MLKFSMQFVRLSFEVIAIVFYVLFLYACVTEGIKVWILCGILFVTAILIISEYSYRQMIKYIAKITIKGEWTELIDASGKIYRHKTVTVRRIKCCLMGNSYKFLVVEEQERIEYKCMGIVKVKKYNEKPHRGIWIDDFRGAEFIS